jgi:hypothetical protein
MLIIIPEQQAGFYWKFSGKILTSRTHNLLKTNLFLFKKDHLKRRKLFSRI